MLGIGIEVQANGTEIRGSFEHDLIKGKALVRFSDGTIFEGDIKAASPKLSGSGKLTYPNGDFYAGTLADGKREGKGIWVINGVGIYEGEFSCDLAHGQGVFTWGDGLKYSGSWKNGVQHGNGVEMGGEGGEKEGEWDNGRWVRWLKLK